MKNNLLLEHAEGKHRKLLPGLNKNKTKEIFLVDARFIKD